MDKLKNKSKYINRKCLNLNKIDKNLKGDKSSNNLILNRINKKKEKIHNEIINLISKNMKKLQNKLVLNNIDELPIPDMDNSSSLDIDNLQKYSGEKISLISYLNSKNATIEKDKKSNNNSTEKVCEHKSKKTKIESYRTKKLIIPKIPINNSCNTIDTNSSVETIINNSNFEKLDVSSEKLENNNNNDFLNRKKREIKIRNILIYDSSKKYSKKYNISLNESNSNKGKLFFKDNHNRNLSLYDSTSTSITLNKLKFHPLIDETYNINNSLKYNKAELINFFTEINLPSIYADKFMENGFDDLNIILALTKTSISITNKNLKDIGIKNACHRSQILIHLEERAEIIPFKLEKHIIYNNKKIKYMNNGDNIFIKDSLFEFMCNIKCENYINNFRRNGYSNSEILFTQMVTRQPITKEMLSEDLFIYNEDIKNRIINGLKIESRNYIKKLIKIGHNRNTIFYYHKKHNSCEDCLIF